MCVFEGAACAVQYVWRWWGSVPELQLNSDDFIVAKCHATSNCKSQFSQEIYSSLGTLLVHG